jgi:[ribosomal protein S18]-alanine N-acetyltransferase
VSVNVDLQVVGPGDAAVVDEAWELKERIRAEEGVLKQRRGFFYEAYRRSTVNLLWIGGDLAGFAATRSDGYVLFLAIAPDHRGEGLGRLLVETVAEEHDRVTCHARTTNEEALVFYERVGFEIVRRIDGYYEDDGDAFYLRLGDGGIRGKLSEFIRR